MDLAYIQKHLRDHRLGWPVRYFRQVTSTQDIVVAAATVGAKEGLLVLAEVQTAGRGRGGRSWWAPPGTAILCSLLLRPRLPPSRVSWLGMITGLAVLEALDHVACVSAALKWPNDVWLHGKKLGGILVDILWHGDEVDAAIIGMGLNVTTSFPAHSPLSKEAISLRQVGVTVEREALLVAYVHSLARFYTRLLRGWSPVNMWRQHLCTLGRSVRVITATGAWHGWAEDVTEQGELIVRRDKDRVIVRAADVHLRHWSE